MPRVLVILLLLSGTAVAQPVATSPPDRSPHPHAGYGADVAFGWAGQRGGPDGWVARFEYELLPSLAPRGPLGAVFGFKTGFEYWRSGSDDEGLSLPIVIVGGIRVFPIRALLGIGFDGFVVDQVAGDRGFGLAAPLSMARVGLDILGFQLGVDARLGYRWQFGADDHARWQLGVFIGRTLETKQTIY